MSRVPMGSSMQGGHPQAPLDERFASLPHQGIGAELIAAQWKLDRENIDAFYAESHRRAAACEADGGLGTRSSRSRSLTAPVHTVDETVRPATSVEGLAGLKPSFHDAERRAVGALFRRAQLAGTVRGDVELPEVYPLLISSSLTAARARLDKEARGRQLAIVSDGLAHVAVQAALSADHRCCW